MSDPHQARRAPRQVVRDRAAEHIVAAIGRIDIAAARQFVEQAAGRPSLRQLEAYLASHPDALTSGSSDAPAPVQRLAVLLAEAKHAGIVVPRCIRCGEPRSFPHIVDGGRVCDTCYRHFRRTSCSRCGKDRPMASRDDQGRPLCGSCTPRRVENCGQCGRLLRVAARQADGAALCPNCYRTPEYTCCRCGQVAPTAARTADGPICKACYQQPKRRCGACGDVRRIDCRANGAQPDICGRCRARRKRPRVICSALHPANPRARLPVCLACREAGHILEPDLTEPPDRTRRRRNETAHDALHHKLHGLLNHPEHGIADQLTPLIAVFNEVRNPANVMGWLHTRKGGARLLYELAMRAHDEPITHELLDTYPQGYALHRLRDLLVHAEILPERTELLDRIEPWLDHILTQRPHHHASVVRPFATWQALRRARQRAGQRTVTPSAATYVRTQITIALDFLEWLDDHSRTLATATQSNLDAWLDQGKQTRHYLATFITWANARSLCDLTVPHRPQTEPEIIATEDDRWTMLRRCLHDTDLPLEVRAAGILVLLFGRTTTNFAHLTVADIQHIDGETYLRLGDFTALLPPAVAAVFHALRDATTSKESFHRPDVQTRFLFPGRSPGKPAAQQVLTRKLRAHGINPLPARHSARAAWARNIPTPIAADLLGINISTATRWANRIRRDWADYLAARATTVDG